MSLSDRYRYDAAPYLNSSEDICLSGMPTFRRKRLGIGRTLWTTIVPESGVFIEDVVARMDCEKKSIAAIEETALQKIEPEKIPNRVHDRGGEWRLPPLFCPFTCPSVGVGNVLFQEIFVIVASVVQQGAT
jgi:hypothetical protein